VEHPKEIGDRSTLAAMLGLKAASYALLVPFGENTRYDLVIDDGKTLARVQCKTGRLRGGAIVFAVTSTYGHHRNPITVRRAYSGEIDYFAIYCPETTGVYLVPISEVPTRSIARLRVVPARNGQEKRIRHAADYEIARVPVTTT
jgi:PD-(D/E)XK endonuclease